MLLSVLFSEANAQPIDIILSEFETVGAFDDAVGMAIDPAGKIYVVDAGTNSVKLIDRGGRVMRELGGPGRSEGQFDEPADIDPTNGLVLVVADAGNGRIQRFSSEFLFLESLPVQGTSGDSFGQRPHYRQREQDLVRGGAGRPIAVETAPNNVTFAIDAVDNVVLKWDVDRNLEYAIGAYDQGEGALLEPVALALDASTLFVADRGREAVFVYDAFGGFDRSMADGLCADVRALELAGDWLVVALPDRLLWFNKRGRLERVVALDLPEEVIDIAYSERMLYVLGTKTLYRTLFEI